MLRLTSTQVATLTEERMLATIGSTVEKTLAHRLPAGQPVRELVARIVRLGRDYGIASERGLTRFVCLTLIVGEDSVRRPEVLWHFRQIGKSPDRLVGQMLKDIARKGIIR
jgi:hypothetical protein